MGALSLSKLYYNVADDSGSTIGSVLLSADGTKLTHTTVGGTESLDVNVTQSSGQYAEDSVHASGAIGSFILAVRGDADTALAADGDYHPLMVGDDGRLKTQTELGSDVADDAPATENPLPVSGVAQNALLTALSAAGDKGNLTMDLYRRVYMNASAAVAMNTVAESVTTTAAQVLATPMAGRMSVLIQNLGNRDVFVGFDATVTAANGLRIVQDETLELEAGEFIGLWMIASSGTQDVRLLEIG